MLGGRIGNVPGNRLRTVARLWRGLLALVCGGLLVAAVAPALAEDGVAALAPAAGPNGLNAGGAQPPAGVTAAPVAMTAAVADSALALGERALARGEPDLALRVFRGVPQSLPQAPWARFGEARCWLALDQGPRAIEALRDLVAPVDSSARAISLAAGAAGLLGQTHLAMGNTGLARKAFQQLAKDHPDLREWATVMVARTWQSEASYVTAAEVLAPVLRDGRCAPAYDLALDLYWKLDGGSQRELGQLMRRYLHATNRTAAGGSRP